MVNGQEFRESDEAEAISRFREIVAEIARKQSEMIALTVSFESNFHDRSDKALEAATRGTARLHIGLGGTVTAERTIPADQFWAAVRRVLIEQPGVAAEKTGIRGLARLPELNLLPHDPICLEDGCYGA